METSYLYSEWTKDNQIDRGNLDKHLTDIPILHGKYLSFYLAERKDLRQLENERAKVKLILTKYYLGGLSTEQLKELGRKPHNLKLTYTQLPTYIESDKMWHDINDKYVEQQDKVEMLKGYIKNLNARGYDIHAAIKYIMFKHGAN